MTVILINNGDGVLVNGNYAHTYSDMEQLASDIKAVMGGDDCSSWDNNEIEDVDVDTMMSDTIGCYVVDLDDINASWGANAATLAQALKN